MAKNAKQLQSIVSAITSSRLSIYDKIPRGSALWIENDDLEALLNRGLRDTNLAGFHPKTRSKVVKVKICQALGYPVPPAFKRTKPRFPGQVLDAYNQQRNNLQIWNEPIEPGRRYAIIKISDADVVELVKVVNGTILEGFANSETLTGKYQARLEVRKQPAELICSADTANLQALKISGNRARSFSSSPILRPTADSLLPIKELFHRLTPLLGQTFEDAGFCRDRVRGGELHQRVCRRLGYPLFEDDGQFPDVKNQLLEVKMQTSTTIDLGRVRPDSTNPLTGYKIDKRQIRERDVRYAIFYGATDDDVITLTHLFLTTGEAFFTRFPQFKGKVFNTKRQIPLPDRFFE